MKYRFLCVILCAVLLIGFCACEGSGKHVIKRTVEPAAVDHVWLAALSPFPEHISASGTMTVSGDKVLMNGTYREDSDSRNAQDILLQFFPAAGTYNYDPFPTPEGMPSGSVMVCGILLPDGGSASVYTVSGDGPMSDEYDEERDLYHTYRQDGWGAASAGGRTDAEIRAELNGRGIIGHMTEEDETFIRDMPDGIANAVSRRDDTILSMITEDASYFFSGAKTPEETQRIIEGRVSIYISETMG